MAAVTNREELVLRNGLMRKYLFINAITLTVVEVKTLMIIYGSEFDSYTIFTHALTFTPV